MLKKISIVWLFLWVFMLDLSADYPAVDGNQYKRFVESVEYRQLCDASTLATITLSDGTKWNFHTQKENDRSLYFFQQDIVAGEEVLLDIAPDSLYYRIFCQEASFAYLITIDKETFMLQNSFPYIEKIDKILVEEGGWFSSPKYVYYIYLSDDSIWVKNYMLSDLKVGDRLIITQSFFNDFEYWDLININGRDKNGYDGRIERYLRSLNVSCN